MGTGMCSATFLASSSDFKASSYVKPGFNVTPQLQTKLLHRIVLLKNELHDEQEAGNQCVVDHEDNKTKREPSPDVEIRLKCDQILTHNHEKLHWFADR